MFHRRAYSGRFDVRAAVSMSGAISGCVDPTANDPAFRGRYRRLTT
jgi:hypothetical protein